MKIITLYGLVIILLYHCQVVRDTPEPDPGKMIARVREAPEDSVFNPQGETILTRFKIPHGYRRTTTETGSFGSFLRNLPLKPHGANVLLYDGSVKPEEKNYCAVVNMAIGDKNLQQCADAIIRLRAEYLFDQRQHAKIHFYFTNGERADFINYAEGYRAIDIENNMRWVKTAPKDYSHKTLLNYLELVFTYAGSYSLSRELMPVRNTKDIQIGDVFIQGGFPGHAIIVVDLIQNEKTGEKQFLLAQSYMPAQEIHLLVNPKGNSPWYPLASSGELITPEWIFNYEDLKRFVQDE